MKKIRFGFTLIELLVVISIIGLLATVLIANLNSTRGRARDAVRKSDLRQLVSALRLYANDQGGFPCAIGTAQIRACGAGGLSACAWGTDQLSSRGSSNQNVYISVIPADPVQSPQPQYEYGDGSPTSCSGDTGVPLTSFLSTKFIVMSTLENVSDQDAAKSQLKCPYSEFFSGGGYLPGQYVLCAY